MTELDLKVTLRRTEWRQNSQRDWSQAGLKEWKRLNESASLIEHIHTWASILTHWPSSSPYATGQWSPFTPLSSPIASFQEGRKGQQWGAAADEQGGKERVKGRVRKHWSVRQMKGVLSHTVGLCQHPCMVAKGTTYLSWSLFHTDSFSFHTSSASIIFFFSFWFKTASLSWADSEMKSTDALSEFSQSLSVRERGREGGAVEWS